MVVLYSDTSLRLETPGQLFRLFEVVFKIDTSLGLETPSRGSREFFEPDHAILGEDVNEMRTNSQQSFLVAFAGRIAVDRTPVGLVTTDPLGNFVGTANCGSPALPGEILRDFDANQIQQCWHEVQ